MAWKMPHVSVVTVPPDPNMCQIFPSKTGQGSFRSSSAAGWKSGKTLLSKLIFITIALAGMILLALD